MNWREIECLAGIPRSTGATPIQNVGAYGQQVAEVIVSARARDRQAAEVVELTGTECEIAYGSSTFRGSARHVVLGGGVCARALLARTPGPLPRVRSRGRGQTGGRRPPLAAVREAVLDGGGTPNDDAAMAHSLIADPASEVVIQSGAVVSKVVHRGGGMNVTVFGFDSGEELTEHQAGRAAVVQVLSGRLRFTVDGEQLELSPGSWLQMAPGTPHSLIASEPTVMLLTLVGS